MDSSETMDSGNIDIISDSERRGKDWKRRLINLAWPDPFNHRTLDDDNEDVIIPEFDKDYLPFINQSFNIIRKPDGPPREPVKSSVHYLINYLQSLLKHGPCFQNGNDDTEECENAILKNLPKLLFDCFGHKVPQCITTLDPSDAADDGERQELSKQLEELFFDIHVVDLVCWLNDRNIEEELNEEFILENGYTSKYNFERITRLFYILYHTQLFIISKGWLKLWNWILVLDTVYGRHGMSGDHIFLAMHLLMRYTTRIKHSEILYNIIPSYQLSIHNRTYLPKFTNSLFTCLEVPSKMIYPISISFDDRRILYGRWQRFIYDTYQLPLEEIPITPYVIEEDIESILSNDNTTSSPLKVMIEELRASVTSTNTKPNVFKDLELSDNIQSYPVSEAYSDITSSITSLMSRLNASDKFELVRMGLSDLIPNEKSSRSDSNLLYTSGFICYHITLYFISNINTIFSTTSAKSIRSLVPYFAAVESCLVVLIGLQRCSALMSMMKCVQSDNSILSLNSRNTNGMPKSFSEYLSRCRESGFIEHLCTSLIISLDQLLLDKNISTTTKSDDTKKSITLFDSFATIGGSSDHSFCQEYIKLIIDLISKLANVNALSTNDGTPLSCGVQADQNIWSYVKELRRNSYQDLIVKEFGNKVIVNVNPNEAAITSKALRSITTLKGTYSGTWDWHNDLYEELNEFNKDGPNLKNRLRETLDAMTEKYEIDDDPENGIEEEYKRKNNPMFQRSYATLGYAVPRTRNDKRHEDIFTSTYLATAEGRTRDKGRLWMEMTSGLQS